MRALVLGGSGVLGREVCRDLAAAGARVAFTWHRGEVVAAELAAALPGALSERLDLADVGAIDRVVRAAAERLGGLDALVHCAAIGVTDGATGPVPTAPIASIDEAGWDRMMAVNVKSAFFACRAAAPLLRAAGGGNVVLVGSIDGVRAAPAPAHYAASKGALQGMMQALTKELGPWCIRINLVAPGVMEGGVSRTLSDELRREYVKHCGLGRVARPAEIAALISWIARENTYVTGQTLVVDGAL